MAQYFPVVDGREPAVVYETIGGFTYRVLDSMDEERFGPICPTEAEAAKAAYVDGYYPILREVAA